MFRPGALALYKNRPVLILEVRDKIEIRLEDGQGARVRDKDLVLLHEGPAKALPSPAEGGDFDTARRMLDPGSSLPWAEMAELVFGEAGPAQAIACLQEASKGALFKLVDGLPLALDDEEVAEEARKRERKAGEASERAAFVERAKKARASSKKGAIELRAWIRPSRNPMRASSPRSRPSPTARARRAGSAPSSASPRAPRRPKPSSSRSAAGTGRSIPIPTGPAAPSRAPAIVPGTRARRPAAASTSASMAWAIDNAWSKDPDDAIAWDGECVWVHVADPASAILPDSEADREALSRGSTLYLPELTSPMLPREALERFGLGLSDVSPALSFRIDVAEDGSISEVEAWPR